MISECRNRIKKNAQDAKCFLCIFCFFIGNFSFPIKQKTLREDAHLAEKKLAANSTARARKSRIAKNGFSDSCPFEMIPP